MRDSKNGNADCASLAAVSETFERGTARIRKAAGHGKAGIPYRTAATALILVLLLSLLCGCGQADISSYADKEITVSGLAGQDFTVTPAELAAMDCVNRSDTGATEKAGTVKAHGPLLPTFLEAYGYSIDQIDRVRFFCKDEYKVVLKKEYLTDYDIILSVSSGSKILPEKEQPLRILIPEAESSKWAYGVIRMEFVLK